MIKLIKLVYMHAYFILNVINYFDINNYIKKFKFRKKTKKGEYAMK